MTRVGIDVGGVVGVAVVVVGAVGAAVEARAASAPLGLEDFHRATGIFQSLPDLPAAVAAVDQRS
jgi:hypothetical protein